MVERFDLVVFDAAVKHAAVANHNLEPHFIYAGEFYQEFLKHMEAMFHSRMSIHKIQSALITLVNMQRWDIVTKETMIQGYKGRAQ